MNKTHLIFTNQELIVKENYNIKSIQYLNILCFVYKSPYTVVKTNDYKEIFIYSSLSSIIKNLPEIFFHCSRVVIVNLLYINTIECTLDPPIIYYSNIITEKIVIPRRKKQKLIDAFLKIKTRKASCKRCIDCLYFYLCLNDKFRVATIHDP